MALAPNFKLSMGSLKPDKLAERLQDFAVRVGRLWSQQSLIKRFTAEDMETDEFREDLQVVVFFAAADESAAGQSAKDLDDAIVAYVPSKVKDLLHVGVQLGLVTCAPGGSVDCDQDSVEHTQIQLFGIGKGRGEGKALLREPFGDIRDVEVVMDVLVSTVQVMVGLNDSTAVRIPGLTAFLPTESCEHPLFIMVHVSDSGSSR